MILEDGKSEKVESESVAKILRKRKRVLLKFEHGKIEFKSGSAVQIKRGN